MQKKKLQKPKKKLNYGLNRTYMPRVRKEFVDMDYLKELSQEERAWLSKFSNEYYGRSLSKDKPHRNLHKTKELIKDCSDRNNRQNNDLYGVTQANGLLDKDLLRDIHSNELDLQHTNIRINSQYIHPGQKNAQLTEDSLIEYIDNQDLLEYDTQELNILYDNIDDPGFFELREPKKKRKLKKD